MNLKSACLSLVMGGVGSLSGLQAQTLPGIINDTQTILVDVRTADEFGKGSVESAVNIPVDELANRLDELSGKTNVVVFCRSGRRAERAVGILKQHGIEAHNGQTVEVVRSFRKVNLSDYIRFYPDRASIHVVRHGKRMRQIAVGLGKGAVLSKHDTDQPTHLIVVKGTIDFTINGGTIRLNACDTYEIPVRVVHEVTGIDDENLFILTKGAW